MSFIAKRRIAMNVVLDNELDRELLGDSLLSRFP